MKKKSLLEKSVKEKFKISGISLPVSANVAADCLSKIYEKNHHHLTPQVVVKEAEAKRHPLHSYFEWNNTKAAKKWRIEQARQLIKCVHIVSTNSENKQIQVRAFVNIKRDKNNALTHNPFINENSYYVSVKDAMSNNILRQYTVDIALAELENWMNKYRTVKELADFFELAELEVRKFKKKSKLKAV